MSEYNTQLWNSTTDDMSPARKQVREQKRRLTYIANIMVITDPKNPENEGQVRLYKFGKKIFDKITLAMNPQYEDEKPMNPFDLWNGANFKIKIRQVEGYRNYDLSSFDNPSALSSDDAELEKIWKSEYSLKEFTDPKNFKSYDELKAKLNAVLGLDIASVRANAKPVAIEDDGEVPFKTAAQRKSVTIAEDEDEDLNYFKGLAEE